MSLDVGSHLPAFAVVEDADHHDSTRARTLCAGLTAGDVCLADWAYTDFPFLDGLRARGGMGQARPGRDSQNLWDSTRTQTG